MPGTTGKRLTTDLATHSLAKFTAPLQRACSTPKSVKLAKYVGEWLVGWLVAGIGRRRRSARLPFDCWLALVHDLLLVRH